jgi:hypothetical protein
MFAIFCHVACVKGGSQADVDFPLALLVPFFKSIIDQINTDPDKTTISKDEMQKALKDEKLSQKLSRLICLCPSEWWSDEQMQQWQSVFDLVKNRNAELLKERLRNLCWWDQVATKAKSFPLKPDVYHWNPVGFVEQMNAFGIGTELNLEEKMKIVRFIALFESGKRPYCAVNRDYEFEGYFDFPKNWHKDKKKAKPDSLNKNVEYSKYSANPRHVGLSFGLIQFTQEYMLGVLVQKMYDADPKKLGHRKVLWVPPRYCVSSYTICKAMSDRLG